jgi:uncharacterized protein (TIGR00251 family)
MFTPPPIERRSVLIRVHVTPNAKQASVVKVGEAELEVRVDEAAMGGRANKRLLEILSEHFRVPKSRISIVRGARSRDKVLEVVS